MPKPGKGTPLEKTAHKKINGLDNKAHTDAFDDYHWEDRSVVRDKPKERMSKKERRRQRAEA